MKFSSSIRLSLSTLIAVLLFPSEVPGQRIIDEDFESYEVGESVDGLHPGDAAPFEWAVWGFQIPGASAVVAEGESVGGSGANQRLLHLLRPQEPQLNFKRGFEEVYSDSAPNGIRAGMKFKVEDLDEPSDLVFAFLERSEGAFNTSSMVGIFRMRFQEGALSRFYYRQGPADGSSGNYAGILEVPFYAGQWYELVLTLHLAEQTWSFELSNLETGEFASATDISLEREVDSVAAIGLANRTPPAAMNHFFDDIFVEIVE